MLQQMARHEGTCLFLFCAHSHLVSALPFTPPFNSTDETVGWVSGPSYRSTLSIITSCILTMGLCVWSALHLNIPAARETAVQYWLRVIKWILMGIFGPELVVFAAWKQYVSARAMQRLKNEYPGHLSETDLGPGIDKGSEINQRCEAWNEGGRPSTTVETTDEKVEWTVVHGFYAAMGGFVFELDSALASVLCLPNSEPYRLTITPRGLTVLAQCGVLPMIPEKEIRDKSKADGLGKAIVCCQAAWMVSQTIARVAYGLPVSLLEVNTIGHVVCAVFIYILWWHKPRLIREPTVIRGHWVPRMAVFLWLSSRMSEDSTAERRFLFGGSTTTELSQLAFVWEEDHVSDCTTLAPKPPQPETLQHRTIPCLAQIARKPTFGSLGVRHTLEQVIDCSGCTEPSQTLRGGLQAANARWMLALEAAEKFPVLASRLEAACQQRQGGDSNQGSETLLEDRANNWSSRGLLTSFRGVLMGMALWSASIAFGAVHTAAWNDHFPSKLEAWLWRASSLDIMASGIVWLTINFFGQISVRFDQYWDRVVAGRAHRSAYAIVAPLCCVCGLAYGFARVFLVVESIISLRALPARTYLTPDWTLLVPHL